MKVVLINHSDSLGGASVVTFRLMEALVEAGVDARMVVASSDTGSDRVAVAAEPWRVKASFLAEHAEIFAFNGFSRRDLFKISIATSGLPLWRHPWVREADVVMLNWINQGMLSLHGIAEICRIKPVIWTMHDMWPVTGVCHHAGGCRRYTEHCMRCPLLSFMAGRHDLSAITFNRKKRLYDRMPIHFVAVSQWLEACARRSALTAGRDLRVISNPFPVEDFSLPPTMSRTAAGLPEEGKLVVMCAARLDDPIKGLPIAIRALNKLGRDDVHAIFIGTLRDKDALQTLKIPHRHLGPIYDLERLRSIYAHASVVLSTSSYESFGATLLEGQAAGCTPVAFVHDGRADIVTDGLSGYTATYPDAASVATAIGRAIDHPISHEKLAEAAMRHSSRAVAAKYIALFNEVLAPKAPED